MKLQVLTDIDPPDREHCLNPESKRRIEHCKFMNWIPYLKRLGGEGCEYKCVIYDRKLYKRQDGTIRRPKTCREREE